MSIDPKQNYNFNIRDISGFNNNNCIDDSIIDKAPCYIANRISMDQYYYEGITYTSQQIKLLREHLESEEKISSFKNPSNYYFWISNILWSIISWIFSSFG